MCVGYRHQGCDGETERAKEGWLEDEVSRVIPERMVLHREKETRGREQPGQTFRDGKGLRQSQGQKEAGGFRFHSRGQWGGHRQPLAIRFVFPGVGGI